MTGENRSLWPLPDIPEPEDTLCFKVYVPADEKHIEAFFGALYGLTRWYKWARDPQKRGKDAARAWMQRFMMTLAAREEGCEGDMSIIFRQDECLIEYSLDDGEHWHVLADLSECPPKIEELQSRLRYLPGGKLVWYDPADGTYRPFWYAQHDTGNDYAPRRYRPEEPGPTLRCRFTQSLMSKLIYAYNETYRIKANQNPITSFLIVMLRTWLTYFNLSDLGDATIGPMLASLFDNWSAFSAGGMSDVNVRGAFCIIYEHVPENGEITDGIVQAMILDLTEGQPSQSPLRGLAAWLHILGAVGVQNAGAAEPNAFVVPCEECDDEMAQGTRPYVITFGDPYGNWEQGWPHYTVQNAVRIPSGGHIGPYVLVENKATATIAVRIPTTTFPTQLQVSFRFRSVRPMAPAASQLRMRMRFYNAGGTLLHDSNGGWMQTVYHWQHFSHTQLVSASNVTRVVLDFYPENNANAAWDFGIDHISIN